MSTRISDNTDEGWQAQADARCAPTARRVAAVELLIAQGYTWQGGAWVAPAKPEAVRLRDELRERAEQSGLELPPLPISRGFIQWHTPQALHQAHGFTSTQMQDYARAALAATGKQQVGDEVEDERFPGGFADAITYVNKLEELAEGLHEQVIGCRSDGEDGASTLLQLVLSELKEKAAQIGEEVPVEEDVYHSIADMIEPYVQREGSNPDGPLPASVHDSVQIIFDHWLKTRAQVGEVQGDTLPALPKMGYEARGTGMGPNDVYYTPVAYTAEQMQDYARAALAARPPVDENYEAWAQNAENVAAEFNDERAVRALRLAAAGIRSAARQPVGQEHLREAIATVCEGWTLPADARKILEKAMWEYVPPAQAVDLGQLRKGIEALRVYSGGYYLRRDAVLALIDSHQTG